MKHTEQEMRDLGYVYLGESSPNTKDHRANQLWKWRDELVIYNPEEERIIWRETDEIK
ncbi:MAG: hypothetical protein WCN88_04910 [Candidatus Falkowbacteria bacterium]